MKYVINVIVTTYEITVRWVGSAVAPVTPCYRTIGHLITVLKGGRREARQWERGAGLSWSAAHHMVEIIGTEVTIISALL